MELTDISLKHIALLFMIIILFLFIWLITTVFHTPNTVKSVEVKPVNPDVGDNKTPQRNENQTPEKNENEDIVIKEHNITRYIDVINEINMTRQIIEEIKLNLTDKQSKLILNLKPHKCFSPACNEGFFKAKNEVLDILKWNKSKFKESIKTGMSELINPKKENESLACFELEHKLYGDYLTFDNRYWRLVNEYNESVLENILNKINQTEFNDTLEIKDFLISEIADGQMFSKDNYVLRKK
jgi:hypothetical protein